MPEGNEELRDMKEKREKCGRERHKDGRLKRRLENIIYIKTDECEQPQKTR